LQEHYDIVILGSGQIAQALLDAAKSEKILVLGRSVHKLSGRDQIDALDWVCGEAETPDNVTADVVINCIMPQTKKVALKGIDCGTAIAGTKGTYIHLSSIAALAQPKDSGGALKFQGDSYIRIKKAERTYLSTFGGKILTIFPGIVVGNRTGWDGFFSQIANAQRVTVGVPLNNKAPVIALSDLAEGILDASLNAKGSGKKFLPDLTDESLPTWEEYLLTHCPEISVSRYGYFPSKVKNSLLVLLNSHLVPNFAWEIIGLVRLKRSMQTSKVSHTSQPKEEHIFVTGMTNFYLGCDYVL